MTNNAEFYRTTVFLPTTDFPMRGGLAQKEPEILAFWRNQDIYKKKMQNSRKKTPHVLHDGPPYANGHIHIGHAENKILKDMVNRAFYSLGYYTPYIPGWDCHGLPIEWKVEEQYRARGEDKDAIDKIQFRNECRAFAQKWVDIQSEEFQRLGVTGDWDKPYLTMHYQSEADITREIHKFALNGGLYKGVKPVMWSTVEKTALAEAEVEYKEHKSITIWVRFPVINASIPAITGADIVIWTTTPWTMPSNRAVAYGDEIDYVVLTITETAEGTTAAPNDKIILAASLVDAVCSQAKITAYDLSAPFKGADLAGTICAHPLRGAADYYGFDVPALSGDFVSEDAGTGFVHIAPGHGADDFDLGRKAGLEVTDNVTDDGRFRPHVDLFAGLEVYTDKGEMGNANFAVIKAINEAGKLLSKGSIRHDYPHSWRSKAPVIFRTTPQWFISMQTNDLRQTALRAIDDVTWVPAQGKNRIRAMVEQRPDWCISRQRAWGVPIALFLHKETGETLLDKDVFDRIGTIFETQGSDAWWSLDPQEFLGDAYDAADYTQIFDIVDVWFESGSTHAFVVEAREELGDTPVSLYLEGSDQHRGWFQSSLLESCGTRGRAPYKTVLTHGFTLDEKGYKMSKSLGNVIAPSDIIKEYGADILRLWVATSDYSEDIRIGQNTIKTAADLYRRIRNTLRFLLGALDGFTESEKLNYNDMPELEQWMLHQLFEMDKDVRGAITAYEFSKLTHRLHNFCGNELSAFYFDIRKDSLYCDRPDSVKRRACRTVLFHIYEYLTAWFAPILPFTAEETWQYRPAPLQNHESIHLQNFPTIPTDWQNKALHDKWDQIQDIRRVIFAALEPKRADKTIGSSLEAHPIVYVNDTYKTAAQGLDLAEIAIISQITLDSIQNAPDDALSLKDVTGVAVSFGLAEGNKCQRCWKITPDVGSDPDYPDLTQRDADAVRWFVQQQKAA